MGIQSFVPSSGGGMPGASFIAAIQMTTYNRSWAQVGGPGDYVLVSSKLSNGYAYFIQGGSTQGVPLGNIINLPNGFTNINVVAPKDDYIMLYKVATKTTTTFSNPFANFSSFPSTITSSGNFVLPNNALPLVNVLVAGGGGGSYHHSGGGGGGNVITLTAYQAVGTTSVTIGGASSRGSKAGDTYFGNVYAIGGGGTSGSDNGPGINGGNGGGGANHGNNNYYVGGTGTSQSSSTGLGTAGTPQFGGGYSGGYSHGTGSLGGGGHVGGGGGGAGGAGANRPSNQRYGVLGGAGFPSDISGSTMHYGAGGGGSDHNTNSNGGGSRPDGGSGGVADGSYAHSYSTISYGSGGNSTYNGTNPAQTGAVIVRYYIP